MARQSFGIPRITGTTVDEIRQSAQFWFDRLVDQIDQLTGIRGTPTFYDHIDTNGKRIRHVGIPQDPDDAVPLHMVMTKATDPNTGQTYWDAQNLPIGNVLPAVE